MGSSSSCLASAPTRPQRPDRPNRPFLSSLLACGGSSSHAPHELEGDPSELLVNFIKHGEPVADELQSMTKESALASGVRTGLTSPRTEAGASSGSSMIVRKDTSFENNLFNAETSKEGECLCKSKELVPPRRLTGDLRSNDTASTSSQDQSSSDKGSANVRSCMEVVNGIGNRMGKDVSQISAEVIHPSNLSNQELGDSLSDELSVGNHVSEVMAIHNSDPGSASDVSDSSSLPRDDSFQETTLPGQGFLVSDRERDHRGGNVLHVDLVSISPSSSSSSSSELGNREARQNSRRLFWDAFSRRNSRRHSDSQTLVFSTDDADGLRSNDRWLVDFSGDFFDDGVGSSSRYTGSRIHNLNERRWQSRSELLERLHGGRGRGNPQRNICPSGLHPHGTCSCQSILMAEESSTHASVSRIVMLAEALFEVLDEIHRQPLSFSLSVVSLPAPEAVVNSLPIKNHMKPDRTESGDDAAQCYICLSEYEEGDKIRVLPCHHEFHMSCVDKWLKEIHGVCPLCRGVVREGHTEGSVSNSETPSV